MKTMSRPIRLTDTLASYLSFDSLLRAAEEHPSAPEIIYQFRERFEQRRRDDGYPRMNIQTRLGYGSPNYDGLHLQSDPERVVRKLIPGIPERLPGDSGAHDIFSDQTPSGSRHERHGVASITFRQFLLGHRNY